MALDVSHVAFADESSFNEPRFRSVAVVSLPVTSLDRLSSDLQSLITASEFRWADIREGRMRDSAVAIIDHVLPRLGEGLRVDVLVWSTEDSRRKGVVGRDEVADLARMYFHLLDGVMVTKWPRSECWEVFPDQQSEIDWDTLSEVLATRRRRTESGGLISATEVRELVAHPKLRRLQPTDSSATPLIQLADLFAGLGVFSWRDQDHYAGWTKDADRQVSLLDEEAPPLSRTARVENACTVLNHLVTRCKEHRLGVGLRDGGLRTRPWSRPLNFWLWEPQSDADKAPTRRPSS